MKPNFWRILNADNIMIQFVNSLKAFCVQTYDEPNTSYLLTIESLDSADQEVAARVEFYEGELDFPNGDLT